MFVAYLLEMASIFDVKFSEEAVWRMGSVLEGAMQVSDLADMTILLSILFQARPAPLPLRQLSL